MDTKDLDRSVSRRRALQLLGASALAPLVPGCARAPAGANPSGATKLLTVTLQLAGSIQQTTSQDGLNYYYFVVLNLTDNPADPGPVYVPAPPYGFNGFAAPAQSTNAAGGRAQGFVGFVLYCPPLIPAGFEVYAVPWADGNDHSKGLQDVQTLGLSGFLPIGTPFSAPAVAQGSSTLYFTIALDQIPYYNGRRDASGNVLAPPRYLQINFITTNNLPQNPSVAPARKDWDALGEGLQNATAQPYITIDLTQNPTYRNSDFASNAAIHEIQGDVLDVNGRTVNVPELDLVDWSVRISNAS